MNTRIALILAAVVAILALVWFVVVNPILASRKAEDALVGRAVAEGRAGAAKDAIGVITDVHAGEVASDQLSKDTRDEIQSTPGADVPLSPELRGASLKRLCLRDTYRNDPACR